MKHKTTFEVSSVHQLYQDLFITDMKDDIAIANNEVVLLRRVLLEKENENVLYKSKIEALKTKLKSYRRMLFESKAEGEALKTQLLERATEK